MDGLMDGLMDGWINGLMEQRKREGDRWIDQYKLIGCFFYEY